VVSSFTAGETVTLVQTSRCPSPFLLRCATTQSHHPESINIEDLYLNHRLSKEL
jgi:hypothetical protein